MYKAIGLSLAVQLAAVLTLGAQQSPGIDTLFPAQPTGFVNDQAHLLDASAASAIAARLDHLRTVTGAEVTVVTLPSIGDYDAADVAREIGRKWGVGANAQIGDKRRNAGLVMLVVPHTSQHDGDLRIEVGQGLEGAITDATAGQIRDSMITFLQHGDYAGGIDAGTAMVGDLVARDLGVQDSSLVRPHPPAASHRGTEIKVIFYIVLFIIWIISLSFRRRGPGGRGGGGGLGSWVVPYMIGRSFGGGGFGGGGFGGSGFGGGGGGFGGFGGGGGFSGGGAGGHF